MSSQTAYSAITAKHMMQISHPHDDNVYLYSTGPKYIHKGTKEHTV